MSNKANTPNAPQDGSAGDSTNESRRDRRAATRQAIWCEGQEDSAQAKNVSYGGMFIVSDQVHEIGEQLKVNFVPTRGEEVSVNAEVVWRDEGAAGMGLKILGFDRGEQAYERFVDEHLQGEIPDSEVISEVFLEEEEDEQAG